MAALQQAERLAAGVQADDVVATVVGNQANVLTFEHRYDQALTLAVERFLTDLHSGRIDPREIHEYFDGGSIRRYDARAVLRDALDQDRLAQAVQEAAPAFALYPALRRALAQYLALEQDPAWRAPLAALPSRKLEPGQPYAGVGQLALRLERLGDMTAGAAPTDK